MEIAVEISYVTKRVLIGEIYLNILKGIDFTANKGELALITGHSGSGKTTLLSIIAGTLHCDSGEVKILGQKLNKLSDDELTTFRRKHIGFIFQQHQLIKPLNLLQNVSIPLLLNGHTKKDAFEQAAEMLKKVGLRGKEKMTPSRLSGGEQQRVAIARALVHEPQLVICDEPTASLDAENGEIIMQLLESVAKSPNKCAIVVTHDNRIFKYADKITVIENGVILRQE